VRGIRTGDIGSIISAELGCKMYNMQQWLRDLALYLSRLLHCCVLLLCELSCLLLRDHLYRLIVSTITRLPLPLAFSSV
jgi:hypothetical protein